ALREQPLRVRAIDLEALGLPVARGGRPLVPIDPEPSERVEHGGQILLGRALAIGVLHAEDEDPAMGPSEGPVEQRGAGTAHVHRGARARSEGRGEGLWRGATIVPWAARPGRRVQRGGAARRPGARRTRCTLSARSRAATKPMGPYRRPLVLHPADDG